MDNGIDVVLFAIAFFGLASFFAFRKRLYPQCLISGVIAGALVVENFPGTKLLGDGFLAMFGIASSQLGPALASLAMLGTVLYGLHRMFTGVKRPKK